ncbi:MAG: hypothetical protein QNJ71_08325 [Acidimicrobiia bacterium]|nr:hypothetical protein [Acidimicrobiia bacterium]
MRRLTLVIAAIAMTAAACAAADAETDGVGAAPGGSEASSPVAADDAAETVGLAVVETADGEALATSDGRAVYLFRWDSEDTSTCVDGCLGTWPPVPAVSDSADSVDASLVGVIERPEGATQATYNGWPLYFYYRDTAPGDINGSGLGGSWFLVSPDGTAVGEPRGGYGY